MKKVLLDSKLCADLQNVFAARARFQKVNVLFSIPRAVEPLRRVSSTCLRQPRECYQCYVLPFDFDSPRDDVKHRSIRVSLEPLRPRGLNP